MKRANVNRIITVTPNPAVDMTYTVHGITEGSSHRVPTPLSRAGGKGINVARVTHQLGYPVLAIAPTGGAAGQTLAAELWTSGVPHTLVGVAAETRRSIALAAINPNKEGAWTRIEPIEERAGEGQSERGYSRRGSDEESGVEGGQEGIWQTTVITHKVESAESKRDLRGQTWRD